MKEYDSELNPEIVKFWMALKKKLNKKQVQLIDKPLIIHYAGYPGNFEYPKLEQVVAFEYHDGDIRYRWNMKNYSENEMLRMIKLKTFM